MIEKLFLFKPKKLLYPPTHTSNRTHLKQFPYSWRQKIYNFKAQAKFSMHRSLINGWSSKLKPPIFREFTEWWKKKHPINSPSYISRLPCRHDNGTKKNCVFPCTDSGRWTFFAVRKMENFARWKWKNERLKRLNGVGREFLRFKWLYLSIFEVFGDYFRWKLLKVVLSVRFWTFEVI